MINGSKRIALSITLMMTLLNFCAYGQSSRFLESQETRLRFDSQGMTPVEGTLDVEKTKETAVVDVPTTVFLTNGGAYSFTDFSVDEREHILDSLEVSARFLRKYAFIVAASGYDEMPSLEFIGKEGRLIYELFTEKLGFNKNDVVFLSNDDVCGMAPTKDKIENEFKEFLAGLEPNSFVFIYFAGYCCLGASADELFFEPCDVKKNDVLTTSLLFNDLFNIVFENDSNVIPCFVVDVCFDKQIEAQDNKLIKIENGGKPYFLMQNSYDKALTNENEKSESVAVAIHEAFNGRCDYDVDQIIFLHEVCHYVIERTEKNANGRQIPKIASYDFDSVALLKLNKEYLNPYDMKFVLIPADSFRMGDSAELYMDVLKFGGKKDDYQSSRPSREVTINNAYYMSVYEVTNRDFKRFVDETGYKTTAEKEGGAYGFDNSGVWEFCKDINWQKIGFLQCDDEPVVCVSYDDALAFISWLNKTDRSRPSGYHYALPSEAEWEYACRGGRQSDFFWGEAVSGGRGYVNGAGKDKTPWGGNWPSGALRTFPFYDECLGVCPVDLSSFKPNSFGLYHMLGNVEEWCADWYDAYSLEISSDDPRGPEEGNARVIRGGHWGAGPSACRCASRSSSIPTYRSVTLGFRPVLKLVE